MTKRAIGVFAGAALLMVVPLGERVFAGPADDPGSIEVITDAGRQVISVVPAAVTSEDPSPSESPSPSDDPSPSPSPSDDPSPSPSDDPDEPTPSPDPSPTTSPSPTRTTSPSPGGGGGTGGGGANGTSPQPSDVSTSTTSGSFVAAATLAPVSSRETGTLIRPVADHVSPIPQPTIAAIPSHPPVPADVASAPFRPFTDPADRNVFALGLIALVSVALVPFLVKKAREESNR